jgi:TatD DNase family protein
MLIDSHAHLDDAAFDDDREATVGRAREAGVGAIINVGFSEARWATTLALCAAHPRVYAVLGLHPHEAGTWDAEVAGRLREVLRDSRVVGLGEIGLDFYRDHAPHDRQRVAFRAQLALARETGLPVVIHSRAAEEETVATLAETGTSHGVLHSFSGPLATAERALALGLHLSLTGPVSYPKAEHQRELARMIPLDRLLLETDCPYLAPQARRGRRNEPAFLRFTAEALRRRAAYQSRRSSPRPPRTRASFLAYQLNHRRGDTNKVRGCRPACREPVVVRAARRIAVVAMGMGDARVHTLVLATTNPGKVREYERLLAEAGLPLRILGSVRSDWSAPPETGETFAENAILKARHAAAGSSLPALADDSGLEVDGLGGAPGVRSAPLRREGATDEANRRRLITELARGPEGERTGRFRCAIAIALLDGRSRRSRDTAKGASSPAARRQWVRYDSLSSCQGAG